MHVLVGCPVLHREWCLPAWFDAVDESCRRAEVTWRAVFVGDPEHDPATWEVIRRHDALEVAVFDDRPTDEREWFVARYQRMVALRNLLLNAVRLASPDVFVSVDSDVLLHPDQVTNLLATLAGGTYAAVGGKCFLGSQRYPSYAMLAYEGGLRRADSVAVHRVDVIMAIKAMSPAAYRVDYELDHRGEDIGWSIAARRAGLALGWDGRVCARHVMSRDELAVTG